MGQEAPRSTLAYRTTKRIPTGETPFSLAYKKKITIPINISMPTFQVEGVDRDQNDAQLCLILDQSEEKRQQAQIRIIIYQQKNLVRAPQEGEDARISSQRLGLEACNSDDTAEGSREARA